MTSYQRARLGGKGRVEYLLYPEWQGYGVDPAVYHGALAMARALFPGTTFTHIESPVDEALAVAGSVLGLESIAERFAACWPICVRPLQTSS